MTGLKSSFKVPRRLRVQLAGLVGAVLMAALLAWFAGPMFPERLFDRYQRWAPRVVGGSHVHLVLIDAESLRRIGPWPWPRAYLAQLTQRLDAAGAAAVGFDVMFAENDPSDPARFVTVFPELSASARTEIKALPLPDETFGSALWEVPAVVARTGVTAGDIESNALTHAGAAALRVDGQFPPPLPRGLRQFPYAVANVEALEFNAHGQGLINGDPDPDGVTRRYLLAATIAGQPTPGFGLDLVRVGRNLQRIDMRMVDGKLRSIGVGPYHAPVAADGQARLYFGSMMRRDESSAADIIDPGRPLPKLAGKIVLVGPASVGLGDIRTTPLGRREFGVRIHAQAVEALLSGGWLDRPYWALAAEWATGGLLALLAILVLPRLRGAVAAAVPLGIAVVVLALSWEAFVLLRLLLDPLRPLAIGGAAALALAAATFIQTGREARQLREASLTQAGEMKAARDIQFAMLPDRAALAGLDPRLDLDALIEPAQLIGGDLYDAFRLPDGRIVFLVGDVTGKGTPAALFMAVSKALAHSLLRRSDPRLDLVVGALNDELALDSVVEVTMLCGIIDLVTGRIEMVNAGHENPWIVRADGSVAELIMEGGLPLCTVAAYVYPLEFAQLAPGDGLVIITDGVREAQDAAGGFFGSARTDDVLLGWAGTETARGVTARLAAAVRTFEAGTPPSDDLTIMALRYVGPTG